MSDLVHLGRLDDLVMFGHFGLTVAIGFIVRRRVRTSADYFMAGGSMPTWVAPIAFISANLGAQAVIGTEASGRKYVTGLAPLVFYGLGSVGGWSGLQERLSVVSITRGYAPGAVTHAWRFLGNAQERPVGVEWEGFGIGLGFVLSFGYWCTDFVVVQRALADNIFSVETGVRGIAEFRSRIGMRWIEEVKNACES